MKKTTEIWAPVEEVWKMFAHPENVLKIFEELKSYKVLSKNRIGKDATYKWVVRFFGKDFELVEKITEWKENEKLSGKNVSGGSLYNYNFNCYLEPTDCGTRITVEIKYKLPYSILGKILDVIAVRWLTLYLFHRSYERAFKNAKKILNEIDVKE